MQLHVQAGPLAFREVSLSIGSLAYADVFALKNNRTLAETLWHRRYQHLQLEAQRSYAEHFDQPLGIFLKGLKERGDRFYLRFLNRYGDSSFCTFSIPDPEAQKQRGLYCFALGESVVYIGRCNDSFGKRINQGYGRIHPKNCFLDGQATNCHLNAFVAMHRGNVSFHILPLLNKADIDRLERELIQTYQPAWNIALRTRGQLRPAEC